MLSFVTYMCLRLKFGSACELILHYLDHLLGTSKRKVSYGYALTKRVTAPGHIISHNYRGLRTAFEILAVLAGL